MGGCQLRKLTKRIQIRRVAIAVAAARSAVNLVGKLDPSSLDSAGVLFYTSTCGLRWISTIDRAPGDSRKSNRRDKIKPAFFNWPLIKQPVAVAFLF